MPRTRARPQDPGSPHETEKIVRFGRDAERGDEQGAETRQVGVYAYFAPVRHEASEKGYTEAQINDAIDRAVTAVRA